MTAPAHLPTTRPVPAGHPRPTAPWAELYEEALAGVGPTGAGTGVLVRTAQGDAAPLDADRFLSPSAPGDCSLLERCTGPTLDVGCGPGRLTAALAGRGVPVLGIDVAAVAVRLAAERAGAASVLLRDVFAPLPRTGRWTCVLLADGNTGIGGDPQALLARVRELLAPGGRVLLEADRPGTGLRRTTVRLEAADGRRSEWFPWALADADALAAAGAAAGLLAGERWRDGGREFLSLISPGSHAAVDVPRRGERG